MQLQQGEPVSAWASTLGSVSVPRDCGYFHAAIAVLHGAKPLAMTVLGTCLEWPQLLAMQRSGQRLGTLQKQ
jgi:hypothetical protein